MTKKKGYKPPPDGSGMPEAGYEPPLSPPPKVEPAKPWPPPLPPRSIPKPARAPVPPPHQSPPSSRELEQSALKALKESGASMNLQQQQAFAMGAIALSLLALLRFLRETEVGDG